jgi:hypothetical protein
MSPLASTPPGKKILYICGSLNQTTQMHQIAQQLSEHEAWYTPYYVDGLFEWGRKRNLIEYTIGGNKLRKRCLDYLNHHELQVDMDGRSAGNDYDLVVLCTDQFYPKNIRDKRVVLVQEGILDPVNLMFYMHRALPWVFPRWFAGTATSGFSKAYDKFCVASAGYKDYFIKYGVPESKIEVTGIPNFDNCDRYNENDFPYRDYVLVCTSDTRETFKLDNRRRFIEKVNRIANGRQIIFKLHPNERIDRAVREIKKWAPGTLVFPDGSAEEMVANSSVLICQYSSLVYIGLALGKEVHSYFDMNKLKRLLPEQNRSAAKNIAQVCRRSLMAHPRVRELRPSSTELQPAPATSFSKTAQ